MKTSRIPYRILYMGLVIGCLLLAAAIDPTALAAEEEFTISGKITTVNLGAFNPFSRNRRAEIVVQDSKGNQHTIRLGRNTVYTPRRTPDLGDNVTVQCIKQRGVNAGVSVTYK